MLSPHIMWVKVCQLGHLKFIYEIWNIQYSLNCSHHVGHSSPEVSPITFAWYILPPIFFILSSANIAFYFLSMSFLLKILNISGMTEYLIFNHWFGSFCIINYVVKNCKISLFLLLNNILVHTYSNCSHITYVCMYKLIILFFKGIFFLRLAM